MLGGLDKKIGYCQKVHFFPKVENLMGLDLFIKSPGRCLVFAKKNIKHSVFI
jgi:hypothetical protein